MTTIMTEAEANRKAVAWISEQLTQKPDSKINELIEKADGLRRPERLEGFLKACEADARGRTGLEDRPYPQADYLREAARVAARVVAADFDGQGLSGPALGEALRQRRIAAIREFRRSLDP